MSTFSYNTFMNMPRNNQSSATVTKDYQKIGFFKLPDEKTDCVARINIGSVDDIIFANIHKPQFGKKYEGLSNPYAGIACFKDAANPNGRCPLCEAAANGHPVIKAVSTVVYVPMVVAYRDINTGVFSEPVPVVWERPSGFAKELVTKIKDCGGDLRQILLKITRTGTGKETRYIMDYAMPAIYKPELVPMETLSAFDNFNISKHSFWEKTEADVNYYLTNGVFEAAPKKDAVTQDQSVTPVANNNYSYQTVNTAAAPTYTQSQAAYTYAQSTTPVEQTVAPTPVAQPNAQPTTTGKTDFKNFSF